MEVIELEKPGQVGALYKAISKKASEWAAWAGAPRLAGGGKGKDDGK